MKQVHLTEIFNYFSQEKRFGAYRYSVFPKTLQAEEARKKAFEDMDPKTREAFESTKFYKFYPVKTEDTPDVENVKV